MCVNLSSVRFRLDLLGSMLNSSLFLMNHGIRMVWVGRDLKDYQVPTPLLWQGHLPLDQVAVKNFFVISNLNLPSFSLKPLPLVLLLHSLIKSPAPPVGPLQVLEGSYEVSLEPPSLQAEQPQLSQPVLTAEVLQPSDHLRGPPLDPFQQVHVFLC